MENRLIVPVEKIDRAILFIRGYKIMLDADLAEIYGVKTSRLNEQVKRNAKRFPTDFMFQLTDKEKEAYPSYVATGGYLKFYESLQHAYIESWEKATEEDRAKTFKLPNFDIYVFKEIFGFTPVVEFEKKKVTLELTDAQLEKIKNIIG